jgi:hypothetical protein
MACVWVELEQTALHEGILARSSSLVYTHPGISCILSAVHTPSQDAFLSSDVW